MARRLHSHLHRLFRWCVGRGIIELNPMADLPKPGSAVKRDRVLTDTELAAVRKGTEKLGWPFGPAIKLLVLTAARRDEVGSLRWDEIHGDVIKLPAERSKSNEPRIIPLSTAAVDLIATLPRTGDHVFTTNGATAISGWSKAKRALDAAAAEINGSPLEPWRLHDIRRTVATGLQRLGVGLQVVESVLGHVGGSRAGIVGVYQRHRFEVEMRTALEVWARELDRIARGEKAGRLVFAAATFVGEGELVAKAEPIDMRWLEAIKQADRTLSFDPLIAHLLLPELRLGPAECWWLRQLLERLQVKRKTRGHPVPLGQQSRKEVHQAGAAYVRDLQHTTGLSRDAAIDAAVRTYPQWFGADEGLTLANFMKRGS